MPGGRRPTAGLAGLLLTAVYVMLLLLLKRERNKDAYMQLLTGAKTNNAHTLTQEHGHVSLL